MGAVTTVTPVWIVSHAMAEELDRSSVRTLFAFVTLTKMSRNGRRLVCSTCPSRIPMLLLSVDGRALEDGNKH